MELTENTILNKELMQSIPADVAWHYLIIPVDEQESKLSFACGESTNQLELREELEALFAKEIELFPKEEEWIKRNLGKYYLKNNATG